MCQIQSATPNSSSINTTQAARVDHLEPLKSDSPLTLAPDFEFGAPEQRGHFVGLSTVQEPRVTANGSREKLWPPCCILRRGDKRSKGRLDHPRELVGSCYIPFSVLLTMRLSQGKVPPKIPLHDGSRSALAHMQQNPDNGGAQHPRRILTFQHSRSQANTAS